MIRYTLREVNGDDRPDGPLEVSFLATIPTEFGVMRYRLSLTMKDYLASTQAERDAAHAEVAQRIGASVKARCEAMAGGDA